MKTTLDIPDRLLEEIKTIAARGDTSLETLIQTGLRRVIDDCGRAASIHKHLLPVEFPQIPGYIVSGRCHPLLVVGGDWYDCFGLSRVRYVLSFGDTSGKGVSAAILMSFVLAGVRAIAENDLDPAETMRRLNRFIRGRHPASAFVTAFYAVLNPAENRLSFTNAGHNPPMVIRTDGSVERLTTSGPAVGILDEASFDAGMVTLGPGDTLLLYSDGVTETPNALGQEFGEARLTRIATEARHEAPTLLIERVFAEIARHQGEVLPHDDTTLLVLRRVPEEPGLP